MSEEKCKAPNPKPQTDLQPNFSLTTARNNPSLMGQSERLKMIDPYNITRFDRTLPELEELFTFCVCVAGKKATMIAAMVDSFFQGSGLDGTPFEKIRRMIAAGNLGAHLRRARLGKYNLLERCLTEATNRADIDLRTCSPEKLETLPGVGSKTSRFFILHSQPNARFAVIDTHMLKYLREMKAERVPDTIPNGKDYLRLEQIILAEAEHLGLSVADFDLQVWSWYASGNSGRTEFKLAA